MDFSYLEGVVGGEISIALEVVDLFRGQAALWAPGLDSANPEWRAVVHTLKGAARGIGAKALGEACHAAEFGAVEDLEPVRAELAAALAAIAAYQSEKAAQAPE